MRALATFPLSQKEARESKQPGIYRQTRELLNEVDASLT